MDWFVLAHIPHRFAPNTIIYVRVASNLGDGEDEFVITGFQRSTLL